MGCYVPTMMVILCTTYQFHHLFFLRHGLNERAAKLDGSERSWPLPPSKFFLSENTADIAYTQNEIMSNYPTGRTMNTRKIRRLSFHPVQYLCRGALVLTYACIILFC